MPFNDFFAQFPTVIAGPWNSFLSFQSANMVFSLSFWCCHLYSISYSPLIMCFLNSWQINWYQRFGFWMFCLWENPLSLFFALGNSFRVFSVISGLLLHPNVDGLGAYPCCTGDVHNWTMSCLFCWGKIVLAGFFASIWSRRYELSIYYIGI